MRIALGIEYDGSQYHGWQRQPGLYTVQGCLEQALAKFTDSGIDIHCAGRTDTGVHATGQVVHLDTEVQRPIRAWTYGVNASLPKDICVRWSKFVSEEFHARFSALSRRYCYVIYNRPIRPALFRSNVTWHYRRLDHELMAEGAQYLLGENDFSSFRSAECQASSPMRCIEHIKVLRQNDLIIVDVQANAFLHHMVRNIVGVLMQVGTGKRELGWIKEVLEARDRRMGAETAPAYGLYLVQVNYHEQFAVASPTVGPVFLTELL